ncbi:MAG: hypothetical protein HY297_03340 [Thaumarchaeota archaeon]|nr:hypothetical protein [Nitrososphaerota archaeon]
MLRTGIFVTDRLPTEAKKILEPYDVFESETNDVVLAECEITMAWPSMLGPDLISRLKSLRMVQTMSAGVDAVDFALLPDGVKVYSNAGAYTGPVAEACVGAFAGRFEGNPRPRQEGGAKKAVRPDPSRTGMRFDRVRGCQAVALAGDEDDRGVEVLQGQ